MKHFWVGQPPSPIKKQNKSNCEIDTLIKRDNRCQPSYNDVVQFPDNRVIILRPIFIFDNSAYDMIFNFLLIKWYTFIYWV